MISRTFIKKLNQCLSVLLLSSILITGCDTSQKKPEVGDSPQAESDVSTSSQTESDVSEKLYEEGSMEYDMVQNSLMAEGNNERLKSVIARARAGEDVTIGFIGGSITEGYNAGTKDIYAKLVYDYFADHYGTGDNVHYVNAGLSGTPSILGLIRSDRDLFAYEPDLIFIEFAVNDGTSVVDNTGYESLIMKSLTQSNNPAVILLFSVVESGYTCQDNMSIMGFHYDLTRISVKNAIWDYIENDSLSWSDWSKDDAHPNAYGQSLYANFIIHYLMLADSEDINDVYIVPDDYVKGFDYDDMIMVDKGNHIDTLTDLEEGSFTGSSDLASFSNGWAYSGDCSDSESFSFSYTGRALFLVYKDTASAQYGTAEVYVDGEYQMSLYANSTDGWGNPDTCLVFREKDSKTHTVEIKMSEDSLDLEFSILAIGVAP